MAAVTPADADLLRAARIPGVGGLYFIGPFTPRITFYSQQVRALLLARALHAGDQIKPNERVAIVGAGAAGSTMAVALALLGYRVTLYDSADDILHLQSDSSRLLHPHIYEWPRLGSLDESAGLPILDWKAGTGSDVCTDLRNQFHPTLAALTNLIFKTGHTLKDIVQHGSEWELTLDSAAAPAPQRFDHVVLAMGFGEEFPCGSLAPEDYWKPGAIGTGSTEAVAGTRYVVSGNGDGALTVTLQLLIKDFRHEAFTRDFLNLFTRDQLRKAAEAAFEGAPFEADVEPNLRTHVLPILVSYGVLDELRLRLRKDRLVTVNSEGPLFSAGRASQLNQCMVLAVLEAAVLEGVQVCRSRGFVSTCNQTPDGVILTGTQLSGVPDVTAYKHAIFRHGPDTLGRYAPAGNLIAQYKDHVKALLANEEAFRTPPALDDATYNLFETLKISRLANITSQPQLKAAAEQSQRVIEIAIDPAAHILVERGCRRVSEIADECERLSDRFTIDLHISPDSFPNSADLVRLARCSAGRIELRAGAGVHSAWKTKCGPIAVAPAPSSIRSVVEYSDVGLSGYVDAALLRLLDDRLKIAVCSGAATPIGAISPTIMSHVQSTWHAWKAKLDADTDLRFDFLRWLANVEQQMPQPWDGDHATLQRMTNALIMTAAAHAGEPLDPCSAATGNLAFATSAIGLGTGCEAIGSESISVRTMPDDWGVDALILSAASDVVVEDPLGTILDAGEPGDSIKTARRVRPAIIQADRKWKDRLRGTLPDWIAAVASEFASWRKRQDDEAKRASE